MGHTCTWLTSSRVVQQQERAWSGPSQAVGQDIPYPVLFWAGQDTAGLCLGNLSDRVWGVGGGPAPWFSVAPTSPSSLLFLCTPRK